MLMVLLLDGIVRWREQQITAGSEIYQSEVWVLRMGDSRENEHREQPAFYTH